MADREAFWTPPPDWADAVIERDGWSARRVPRIGQTLVSGDIAAALSRLAPDAVVAGLWTPVRAEKYAVRIARDRAVLVTPDPIEIGPGWQHGFAVSAAGDLYAVFELGGRRLNEVVAEATSADLGSGSPSAATLFAGLWALLYRTDEGAARLHVEAPYAAALWTWLDTRAD